MNVCEIVCVCVRALTYVLMRGQDDIKILSHTLPKPFLHQTNMSRDIMMHSQYSKLLLLHFFH